MERKISQGDNNNQSGDDKNFKRSESPTRRNMERLEYLKKADTDLRPEYEQYKKKAREHGEKLFDFDNACNKINSEILNMQSDSERAELVTNYLSEHEKWTEVEINDKFNKLKESLNFAEKEAINEYVEYGKKLRALKEELDDIYKKLDEHNKSVEDHNIYSPNKLNTIENEYWRKFSDAVYTRKVQEAAEE